MFNIKTINQPDYYSCVSQHRSEIMGIAILWVVLFHSLLSFEGFPIGIIGKGLNLLKSVGYGGTDIFFFVSGIGIYNSLSRNRISTFFNNRIKRIVPVWWSYILVFCLVETFLYQNNMSLLELLGNLFFTGYWIDMGNQGNWYVFAIIFFYCVSPILFSIICDNKRLHLPFVIGAILLSASFFNSGKLIVFSRLPIYILGFIFANRNLAQNKGKAIRTSILFLLLISGVTFLILCYEFYDEYLWTYGLNWYPFLLIAPSLTLLLGRFFDCLTKVKFLRLFLSVLKKLGQSSLEILLLTDLVFRFQKKTDIDICGKMMTSFLMLIIGVFCGLLFHYIITKIKSLLFRVKER